MSNNILITNSIYKFRSLFNLLYKWTKKYNQKQSRNIIILIKKDKY